MQGRATPNGLEMISLALIQKDWGLHLSPATCQLFASVSVYDDKSTYPTGLL